MEEKEQRYYYMVEKEQEGMRLDQFLAAELNIPAPIFKNS